ncbi:MAG: corrinoid protein [Spirochaetes bacterium]|nr:corrinoid protein [Spirochaetota bacterium]
MHAIELLKQSIIDGDEEKASLYVNEALAAKIDPQRIVNEALIDGMNVVGERFRVHEIFLPEVLLAAKAMYAALAKIKPLFIKEKMPTRGKVVIGSVQGDLHDIGKNLVAIMLEGAGYEIIDLGTDVLPERFVDEAVKQNAQVIGMSALLTTTMPVMGKVMEILKERGLLGKIKVIIGGAPVNDDFCKEIGADAYCYDAANAVETVKRLLNERV